MNYIRQPRNPSAIAAITKNRDFFKYPKLLHFKLNDNALTPKIVPGLNEYLGYFSFFKCEKDIKLYTTIYMVGFFF